jgi:hypothetical protein
VVLGRKRSVSVADMQATGVVDRHELATCAYGMHVVLSVQMRMSCIVEVAYVMTATVLYVTQSITGCS